MASVKVGSVLISAILSFALVSADVEKLSNSLIRNGSNVIAFTRSTPGWWAILYRYDIPNTDTRIALHLFEPTWADNNADWDSTPDINVLNNVENNASRLYYSARNILEGTAALGVAEGNDVWEDWFITPLRPLLVGSADLTHPSLVQSADGNLTLFYRNSSGPLGLGFVETVALSEDGLKVTGDSVRVLEATEEWEQSGFTSVTAFTHENMFYILYTVADGTTIGAARSKTVDGPFEKSSTPVGLVRDKRTSVRDLQKNQLNWDSNGWPQI